MEHGGLGSWDSQLIRRGQRAFCAAGRVPVTICKFDTKFGAFENNKTLMNERTNEWMKDWLIYATFSLPRPLCSRGRPDVRDRQTDVRRHTDVRQKHRLMPPPYGGGCIINRCNFSCLHCPWALTSRNDGRRLLHAELVMGHFFKTQPNPKFLDPTQPNLQKFSPDPTQSIIDTWYGILGYTENFIQQLLHVTDK